MIALVMAGGKGSRMNSDSEKLLLNYKKPVILHVCDALQNSQCFEKIIALTSPNTPKTQELLEKSGTKIIKTPGKGYVQDLNLILNSIDSVVFVTSGDLPFLDDEIIRQIVTKYNPENTWTSFVLTKDFLESLGLSSEFEVKIDDDSYILTGISIIDAEKINSLDTIKEHYEILDDKRIAFNLNTTSDFEKLTYY
ncbi:MAG: NTP transferase domain-containing protein [Nitrosopumilaceae archaeon]